MPIHRAKPMHLISTNDKARYKFVTEICRYPNIVQQRPFAIWSSKGMTRATLQLTPLSLPSDLHPAEISCQNSFTAMLREGEQDEKGHKEGGKEL